MVGDGIAPLPRGSTYASAVHFCRRKFSAHFFLSVLEFFFRTNATGFFALPQDFLFHNIFKIITIEVLLA